MAYKINEDLYIGNTNKQLKDLLLYDGDTLPIGAITEFDGNTIPEGYEELTEMSGSNANGSWIKFADGTMICTKKIKFTNIVINTVWGSVYETAGKLNFGDYAQEFIEIPNVCITLADGATCFCETFSGRTKKSIGSTWLWKPSIEADGTMTFDVIAIGRWK